MGLVSDLLPTHPVARTAKALVGPVFDQLSARLPDRSTSPDRARRDLAFALYSRAYFQYHLSRLDEAGAGTEEALRLGPGHADAITAALIRLARVNPDGALKRLDADLNIATDQADTY